MNRIREHVPHERRGQVIHAATYRSETFLEGYIRRARRADLDEEREKRREKQLCKYCYYINSGGVAGQAFTSSTCAFCQKDTMFSTTHTDALCLECAQENRVCKECMADMEYTPHEVKEKKK